MFGKLGCVEKFKNPQFFLKSAKCGGVVVSS